jgi:hypothetical protein
LDYAHAHVQKSSTYAPKFGDRRRRYVPCGFRLHPRDTRCVIGVFVARALQHGVIDVPGFTLFAGMRVPNGIAAVLIRETRPIEPQHGADLEHAVSHILTIVRGKGTNLSTPDVRLIIGFDHDLTGGKIVYDVAKPRVASSLGAHHSF